MTQYNMLNVKLSNSLLNQVKSAIKNETEVTLNFSSLTNTQILLLTKTQVSKLCKACANNSSANIKLSKTKLHKIRQLGLLGRLLGPLLKTGLSLMENVLKPLAKNVFIPLGLTAVASATDAAIHKMFGTWYLDLQS